MLVKPIGECDYRWVTSFKTVKLKKRPGPSKVIPAPASAVSAVCAPLVSV